jgi:hypothetical protein
LLKSDAKNGFGSYTGQKIYTVAIFNNDNPPVLTLADMFDGCDSGVYEPIPENGWWLRCTGSVSPIASVAAPPHWRHLTLDASRSSQRQRATFGAQRRLDASAWVEAVALQRPLPDAEMLLLREVPK